MQNLHLNQLFYIVPHRERYESDKKTRHRYHFSEKYISHVTSRDSFPAIHQPAGFGGKLRGIATACVARIS